MSGLGNVRLVAVTRDDRDRIRRWLTDATIRGWWGTPGSVEAEIAIALDSPSAICRMIEADGTAIGYAHAFDAGLMSPGDHSAREAGLWHCAFLIGSEPHRGRGLGAIALNGLATEVLSTTLALGCRIRVPVRNERAVREIEAIGFRWHRVESDQTLGPVWIMRRDRAAV
jgi:RimJ/RimL family protein N-acetyltransferase